MMRRYGGRNFGEIDYDKQAVPEDDWLYRGSLLALSKDNTANGVSWSLIAHAAASLTSRRWRISIWITCVDLLLNNIQGIVFFIGFTRAFASIRRKMMLNILMQVKFFSNLEYRSSL